MQRVSQNDRKPSARQRAAQLGSEVRPRPKRFVLAALAALGALAGPTVASAAEDQGGAVAVGERSTARSQADFASEQPSHEARQIADWAVASGDSRGAPFMVVDKSNARLFLFTSQGRLLGTAPVLLGLGRGDDSPPGIGERPLAQIRPEERITPAGRFEATMGVNLAGQDILWVDYEAALSVHRAADPKQGLTRSGRLARLASATTADNRISHGCVNVSTAFFEQVLRPAFGETEGIVYILPETRSLQEQFPQAV